MIKKIPLKHISEIIDIASYYPDYKRVVVLKD